MQPELSGDKIHHSLHFLTREAADMELRDVEKELERVRSMLSDKDVKLKEQEERSKVISLRLQESLLTFFSKFVYWNLTSRSR